MARKSKKKVSKGKAKRPARARKAGPRCGLCGKTGRLTRTECCGNWICDDEHTYVLFSYARNSCYRNHDRYTLCAYHHHEGHDGEWKDCPECRAEIDTEMYVWYGTNEFNFEKLESSPEFEPTRCHGCGRVIRLAYEGHSYKAGKHYCQECSAADLPDFLRR
jgi:hypothetical protein